ncbi:MAG: ABC transporter permease subunit [Acidimicrobiales bacterium]|jgi:putative spermidine/putrescine transport system permease protein
MASLELGYAIEGSDDFMGPYSRGTSSRSWFRRVHWGRGTALILAFAYFIVPFYAAMQFCLQDVNGHFTLETFTEIAQAPGFYSALWLSTQLAVATMAIVLLLMVPTMIYVHLRMPRFRRVMEVITILPIIIPPIVLIVGVDGVTPLWLKSSQWLLALIYVILAMPYVYRSLDAGLGALDLKTLVEAARSLGSGWVSIIWRVLIPNMRSALLSASVLTLALVFGEFTIASLDGWTTIPVWIYLTPTTNPRINTLVAMMALLGTAVVLMVIVSFDRKSHSRRS